MVLPGSLLLRDGGPLQEEGQEGVGPSIREPVQWNLFTVCPRTFDQIYVVTCYMNCVKTSFRIRTMNMELPCGFTFEPLKPILALI